MTTEEDQRRRRGYWLRLARQRSGLTLKQVAVAMGYALRSQTTIRLWELGQRDPSDIQLTRIAGVYRVPVSVFSEPRKTDQEWLDERVREAIRNGDMADPPARAATG
jgi:transcriptional regulator with XRE-family HTH domain